MSGPVLWIGLYIVFLFLRFHEYTTALEAWPFLPIILGFAGLAWLIGQKQKPPMLTIALMVGFVVSAALSRAFNGWIGGGFSVFAEMVPIFVPFIILISSVRTLRQVSGLSFVILVCAVIMAIHGIFQSIDGIGWSGALLSEGVRITYLGIFNDPNDLSLVFVMTTPFAVRYMRNMRKPIQVLFGITCAAILFYGIYLGQSRGAFLGVLATLTTYMAQRVKPVYGLAMGALGGALLLMLSSGRFENIDANEESAAGRIEAWYTGYMLFRGHPLFGVGKGAFTDFSYLTAHNSFVLAFSELGLIGYFFWLGLLMFALVTTYKIAKIARTAVKAKAAGSDAATLLRQSEYASFSSALFASLVGFVVAGFFLSRTYFVPLFVFMSFAIALDSIYRRDFPAYPVIQAKPFLIRLAQVSVGSIFFLWLISKLLLKV